MDKPYTTHLCTFMGREANLKILLPYIETCLRENAVDNYWFIDMTRSRSDHELIRDEQIRLEQLFPGRVHMHNHVTRGKMIDDPEMIKQNSNDWGVFYRMFENFDDHDIVAKCDDDTYFIDVGTLRAAFEFRWKHKQPYLMHANCINNGVTAYHQKRLKNVWSQEDVGLYPTGGLTGPLFSFPEIPCEHHRQFAHDMIESRDSIEKYKLHDNIHFTNRVSINFIFMLGSDRHTLKDINRQDEYDTSCKYPQREDRPNMIIGDFIVAHHTYGVQEPRMEKEQTHVPYQQLSDVINQPHVKHEHRQINQHYHPVGPIKTTNGTYLTKAWVKKNSYCLQNPKNGLYVSHEHHEKENISGDFLKTQWSVTEDFKRACVFNIDVDQEQCIWVNNSIQLIMHPSTKTVNGVPKVRAPAVMGFTFFQGQFKKNKLKVEMVDDNQCIIRPVGKEEYVLVPADGKRGVDLNHPSLKKLFWDYRKSATWNIVPVHQHHDHVIGASIIRPEQFDRYTNDETHATSKVATLPDNHAPKDYIWTVKDYVWEFIKLENETYHVKLIADDQPDMYLCKLDDDSVGVGEPDMWQIDDSKIKHVGTNMYIHVDEQTSHVQLSERGTNFYINES